MQTRLVQVQTRIDELEALAEEVAALAAQLKDHEKVQPELSIKGQRWYRGAREILAQANSTAIAEFEHCYDTSNVKPRAGTPFPRQALQISNVYLYRHEYLVGAESVVW